MSSAAEPSPPAASPSPEASASTALLAGNVPTVRERITAEDRIDVLEDAHAEEKAAKNRSTVLEALEMRLRALRPAEG